jgi:hypothetical protein
MSKSAPGRPWFFKSFVAVSGIALVFLIIWARSLKEESAPELTFQTDAATRRNLDAGVEEIPHIGDAEILKRQQLRYCLSEGIRLEAASRQANRQNQDHARRLSQMSADHGARCAGFRYKVKRGKSDLEQAQAEVESRRAELETAGRSRFQ